METWQCSFGVKRVCVQSRSGLCGRGHDLWVGGVRLGLRRVHPHGGGGTKESGWGEGVERSVIKNIGVMKGLGEGHLTTIRRYLGIS